ncbi:helix-hairpin-helix domain-containing protein [Peptostreptococcus russellii]|uniref:helix-hairpin-helix domain-containing protein n=1 Tax=Peptostreptococcus russellii TaxID=215200 RepID=UPI003F586CD9
MGKNKDIERLASIKNKISELDKKKLIITSLILLFLLYKIIFSGPIGILDRREKIDDPVTSASSYSSDKEEKNEAIKDGKKDNIVSSNEEKNETITVYITGAVANPGVISLDSNMRLDDALKKLGGTTKDADINRINLAMKLEDSQHYIIPYIGQEDDPSQKDMQASNNSSDSAGSLANSSSASNSQDSKININSADESQLETISGVGPSTAKKIIDYREKEGKFSSIEDIKNVSGIGDKKFESMKDSIDVK